MSAEKIVRVKVTLPAGVSLQTSSTATGARHFGGIDAMADIAMGRTLRQVVDKYVENYAVKSNVPITLTLDVPFDKRAEVAQLFHNLSMELTE